MVTSLNQTIKKLPFFAWWKMEVVDNFGPRIIGNVIGIFTSITCCTMLYIGAQIRNAYFLIPFMLLASFALLGLSAILLLLLFYFMKLLHKIIWNGYPYNEGEMNTLMFSITIIILIPITYWMLRNTHALWDEMCRNVSISRSGATEFTTINAQNSSQVHQHCNVPAIEVSVVEDDCSNTFLPESTNDETDTQLQNSTLQGNFNLPDLSNLSEDIDNSEDKTGHTPVHDESFLILKHYKP
jgi:hypothetical protein